jgi:hypothetical protein
LSLLHSDAGHDGMHGLHHPPVVVHVPTIECECMSDNREACVVTPSHVRELAGACELISNVHGLHAGFEYKSLVHWSLGDEQATQQFDMVFSASSDSYDVRVSLGIFRRFRTGGAFVFDVNVLDMYPGLAEEEALIGSRQYRSSFNTLRISFVDNHLRPQIRRRMRETRERAPWTSERERVFLLGWSHAMAPRWYRAQQYLFRSVSTIRLLVPARISRCESPWLAKVPTSNSSEDCCWCPRGIFDAVVPVTTGIWTLSAVLYCSFARVDSAGIISELKQNVERHPYSTSSEGIVARAHHTTLMLAMSQIELGHVEEARQTLDVAREEYLSSDSIAWKGIFVPWIQELIQMVDHDLAQIDVSTVASHSVVVLVVSQESKNHFTMEQGCPALLSFTPQEKRAGFAEFTWTRTLECLSVFLEKFPTNSEAKLWHSRIDQHCGEREGGGDNSGRDRGAHGNSGRWHQKQVLLL